MHGDYLTDVAKAAGAAALILIVVLMLLGLVIGWICGRPGLGAGAGAMLAIALLAGFGAWLRWGGV